MLLFWSMIACTLDFLGTIVIAILPLNYAARSSGDIAPPPNYICWKDIMLLLDCYPMLKGISPSPVEPPAVECAMEFNYEGFFWTLL